MSIEIVQPDSLRITQGGSSFEIKINDVKNAESFKLPSSTKRRGSGIFSQRRETRSPPDAPVKTRITTMQGTEITILGDHTVTVREAIRTKERNKIN